jgi:hypothetical protein
MIEQIVGQFFQSGAGQDVLRQVQEHGLDEPQARSALSATVEGALQQTKKDGGMESQASGLSTGAQDASAIAARVAQFVATKTGLAPELAQKVVSVALPKVLELIKSASVPGPRPSGSGLGAVVERVFSRH